MIRNLEERKRELEIKLKEITNMIAEFQEQIKSAEGKQSLNLIIHDEKLNREFLEEMRCILTFPGNILKQMTNNRFR